MTRLSVIVPSWNTRDLLRGMLCSLEPGLPSSSDVIVVDNGSQDGSAGMVAREFPHVRLVKNERNEGFARAVNQGLERTRGEYAMIVHPDIELMSGSIRSMLSFLDENERYGAVVPRVLNPDGSPQSAVVGLPSLATPLFQALERWLPTAAELERCFGIGDDLEEERDVEAARSACLLVRRRALPRNEPLDEAFFLYYADMDLCRRLKGQGWRMRYLPDVKVFHHGERSIRRLADPLAQWHRDRLTFYRKHHGRFAREWVNACTALGCLDQLLAELWRRAHGVEEIPLGPVCAELAYCLKS